MRPTIQPPRARPSWVRRALCRFCAVGGWLLAGGCATEPPAPPAAPRPTAATHLLIINQTSYDWRIMIAGTAGPEHRDTPVPARASVTIDLAGGDYLITQTVMTAGAAPELSRQIPARLEPGQTYRWRLDTLLSDSAGDPARGQP